MPGWRDLVDVAVQSLVILQLLQYLHTVSWGNNSIPSRREDGKESEGGYETPHLRSSYYIGRSNPQGRGLPQSQHQRPDFGS